MESKYVYNKIQYFKEYNSKSHLKTIILVFNNKVYTLNNIDIANIYLLIQIIQKYI